MNRLHTSIDPDFGLKLLHKSKKEVEEIALKGDANVFFYKLDEFDNQVYDHCIALNNKGDHYRPLAFRCLVKGERVINVIAEIT